MRLIYNLLYWLSKINWYYVLILLIIPLGEVWKFLGSPKEVDVFLFKDYKLNWEWIFADVAHMLQFIIIAFIAYKQPKISKIVLLAVLLFGILDLLFYFLTFKQGYYALVYYFIAMILIIWKHDKGFRVFSK